MKHRGEELFQKYQGGNDLLSEEDSDYLYLECPEAGNYFDNCHFYCVACCWWCESHEATQDPDQMEEACEDCHPYEEE